LNYLVVGKSCSLTSNSIQVEENSRPSILNSHAVGLNFVLQFLLRGIPIPVLKLVCGSTKLWPSNPFHIINFIEQLYIMHITIIDKHHNSTYLLLDMATGRGGAGAGFNTPAPAPAPGPAPKSGGDRIFIPRPARNGYEFPSPAPTPIRE